MGDENKVEQREAKKSMFSRGVLQGMLKPESRGALAIGAAVLAVSAGGATAFWSYSKKEPDVSVAAGRIATPEVAADAASEMTESYKEAKRIDNKERYSAAATTVGGVALPFTFNEEKRERERSGSIETCGCVIDDEQLIAAMQRLGVNGTVRADYTRVATSDIYLATNGQLVGDDGKAIVFKGNPLYMQPNGQLTDESGIAVVTSNDELLYLGKTGEVMDQYAQRLSMLGDLHTNSGVLILGDGRLAMRPGNMQRIASTDLYMTREGQLATVDGRPVKHSGASTYKNDEGKLVSRTGYEIAWMSQAVYQNNVGQLVNSSGVKFPNPGILFSYEGILIDNDGNLTRPLVNIKRVGDSDIYKTKSGAIVDGYGLPISHYGDAIKITPQNALITASGRSVINAQGAEVSLAADGMLRVEVGKGSVRSGVLKQSDGVALDRRGQVITRKGRMERRGTSDIYTTGDGLIADKLGKPMRFGELDTFIDFTVVLDTGAQGMVTYRGDSVTDSEGRRVYLTLDGRLVSDDGREVSESGILTDFEGVLVTSKGQKIVQDMGLERVVTKDGKPVTYMGKDVYKGVDGRLYDSEGNPILSEDGRAVFMDRNGSLVGEDGNLIENLELMAGQRAVQNGELATRRAITAADGEKLLFEGHDVFLDDSGRVVDSEGNAITTSDGREVFVNERGDLVDIAGNMITEDLLRTTSGEVVSSKIVAGREQVVTKSGSPVTFDGQNVFRGHDGALYDESGNAILTETGSRVYLDDEGNLVDEGGNIVDAPLLKVAGERVVGNGDLITRKTLTGPNGLPLLYSGEDVFVGANGEIYDYEGNRITTSDGREVYLDSEGNIVDDRGNPVTENLFHTASNEASFQNNGGLKVFDELIGDDGSPVLFDGKRVYKDTDGRLVDAAGNAVTMPDGSPAFVNERGEVVDARGRLLEDAGLYIEKVRAIDGGEIASMQQLLGSDGEELLYNGKRVYKDKTGRLFDEDGNTIKTATGESVYVDSSGNLVDKKGRSVEEPLLKNASGKVVARGITLGSRKLFGREGSKIQYNGKDVYLARDGSLVDKKGNQILSEDGKKLFIDDNGRITDASGRIVNNDKFTAKESAPVKDGVGSRKGTVRTNDGRELMFNGQSVRVAKDGSLIDASGNTILSDQGEKLYLDSEGLVVDRLGRKIDDKRFTLSSGGKRAPLTTRRELRSASGKQLYYEGKKVFVSKNGQIVDALGRAIKTENGQSVFMNGKGEITDEQGVAVDESMFSSNELPAQEFVQSELMEEVLDANGSAVFYNGKKVYKGKDGLLRDEDGRLIRTTDDRSIRIGKAGNLVDESGSPVFENILRSKDGKVTSKGLRTGNANSIPMRVAAVLDANGEHTYFNGKRVYRSSDGSLIDEDGMAIKTSNGKLVTINSSGEIVDEDGRSVSEKLLRNSKGAPVSTGVKLGSEQLLKAKAKEITNARGEALYYNGRKVFRGRDGELVDEAGNSVRTSDGRRIIMDKDGMLIDEDGRRIEPGILRTAAGERAEGAVKVGKKTIPINGVFAKEVLGPGGQELLYNGNKVYRTKTGALVDASGNSIKTANGRSVFLNDNGELVDERGGVVTETLLRTRTGIGVSSGITTGSESLIQSAAIAQEVLDKNGNAVYYDGKKVFRKANGELVDESGTLIRTTDGSSVSIDNYGNLTKSDGSIVNEALLVSSNGQAVKSGLTLGDEKTITTNGSALELKDRHGRSLYYKGRKVYRKQDGTLVDESGSLVTTSDGRVVSLDSEGRIVDESGNPIAEDLIATSTGVSVKSGISVGSEELITADTFFKQVLDESGNPLYYDGKKVYRGPGGALFDEDGKPVTNARGEDVYLNDSGELVDRDGKVLKDSVLKTIAGRSVRAGITLGRDRKMTVTSVDRKIKQGEVNGMTEVLDRNGNALFYKGKRVYRDASGRLRDESGKTIQSANGQDLYLNESGKVVDKAGRVVKEKVLTEASGKLFEGDIVLGKTKVFGADGTSIAYDGEDISLAADGSLLDKDGNAILSKDGGKIFLDENGQLVDASGNLVDDPRFSATRKAVYGGRFNLGRRFASKADGTSLLFNGKSVSVNSDGALVDDNGHAILSKEGERLYLDDQGNIVDADGRVIDDPRFDLGGVRSLATVRGFKEMRDRDGRAVKYNGKNVYLDERGRVVDEVGEPVRTASGSEVYVDGNGNLVDALGTPVEEPLLATQTTRALVPGEVTEMTQLLDSHGRAVLYNGKQVYRGKDGRLRNEDGKLIKTKDGRDVYVDSSGNLKDQFGNAIVDLPLKDISGKLVEGPLENGRNKLFTKDGNAILYQDSEVFVGEDGALVNRKGEYILAPDGSKTYVDKSGKIVDSRGRPVDNLPMNVSVKETVANGIAVGRVSVRDSAGKKILYKGKEVFRRNDGQLVDVNGREILSDDGQAVFVGEDGRLINSSGESVSIAGITSDSTSYVSSGISAGVDKVFTKDGAAVKYRGRDVYRLQDGSLVDATGAAIVTSDGRKVYMNEDSQLVDIAGTIISEELLTADGAPVSSGDFATIPAGEMTRIGSSDLFVTREGSLVDASGKAITFNGKKVKVGNNGQLRDENGDAVKDKNGNAVYLNGRGQLTDASGKVIEDSLLATGAGVLIDGSGRSVSEHLSRLGTSDLFQTADGRIVDAEGRSVLYEGQAVIAGDDGRLYTADGKIVTDAKGGSVYLDRTTGKLSNRDGEAISGSVLTSHEGTVIDSLGELVTSGGKLEKVPGTEYYTTKDGQLVDSRGRAILLRNAPAYLSPDGRISNKFGSPIRFRGRAMYLGGEGQIVDRNGAPITSADGHGLQLSASGGIITLDGQVANDEVSGPGVAFGTPAADRAAKPRQPKPPAQVINTPESVKGANSLQQASQKGKKPPAAKEELRIDSAGAERLQRRYLAIKEGMVNEFAVAMAAADRRSSSKIVAVGGTRTSGLSPEEIAMLSEVTQESDTGRSSDVSSADNGEEIVYQKAGSFMYGVSTFQFNTDFPSRTVVELVGLPQRHPLYRGKLIGTLEIAYDSMVLRFTKACSDGAGCVPMDGIALDPSTSAAGLASEVDHHYWYRYGGLFAASLLEGASIAASESTTREESVSSTGTRVTSSGLDGTELAIRSLGKIGERFAEVFASRVDRPVTVYLNPGEEMSIVLFEDIKGPVQKGF